MSNLNSRLSRLESKAPKAPKVFDVQVVDEITDAMRQEQREAHARGERYYIVEETENDIQTN